MNNRFVILVLLVVLSGTAWAGTLQNKIAWDDLGEEEQQVLQPFQDKWNALPPGQQLNLMKGASRWKELSTEQRQLLHQRFKRFFTDIEK